MGLTDKIRRAFRGDEDLPAEGTPREPLTAWQIEEAGRCMDGPEGFAHWCRTYLKVRHVDSAVLVPFELRDYQLEIVSLIFDVPNVLVSIPRQAGKSLLVDAYLLWFMIFHTQTPIATLAHRVERARESVALVQTMFRSLPMWMKPNIVKWNASGIWLESGSSLVGLSAGRARGGTFKLIHSDEFAHQGTERECAEFSKSVFATLSSGKSGRCIMTSTNKGLGGLV
jgi:phage terminase large subunit-like protein